MSDFQATASEIATKLTMLVEEIDQSDDELQLHDWETPRRHQNAS